MPNIISLDTLGIPYAYINHDVTIVSQFKQLREIVTFIFRNFAYISL